MWTINHEKYLYFLCYGKENWIFRVSSEDDSLFIILFKGKVPRNYGFFLLVSLVKKNTTAKNFLNQNFSIENNNPLIYLFNRPYRWSFSLFISYVCNGYIFTLMSWKRPKTNFSNRLENICFFWYIRKKRPYILYKSHWLAI